jgi:two-component system sensor histidine kinase CpxA
MRSVYAKISLWSFATLALSLAAFWAVTQFVSFHASHQTGQFGHMQGLELEQAREAYETGGVPKLRAFIDRLERYLPGGHYLTDSKGRDVLTGQDRSALLRQGAVEGAPPRWKRGPFVILATSPDGLYHWIVDLPPPPSHFQDYLPYSALITGAVALVCWLLAVSIASPLRALARTVERFGSGDLTARVNSGRRDEIGDLGRAFDQMAGRIATLLSAERRLLQDVSHELRSPLARMGFAAELIRTAEDRDAAVARLRKEIQRLSDLVGALLEVTRAEGDPAAAPLEPLRLDELVKEVVDDCQVEAEARRCHIAIKDSAPIEVCGDRELLRRAFENVVRNSIRYAPPESEVEVQMQPSAETACVSVRDRGPGVPEDALDKIFQPFFRVDDARNSATGGAGLGLAIAKRAVGLHHGDVRAVNVQPGLRVSIELPTMARST